MRGFFRGIGVLLPALAAGVAASFPVFVLGLFVPGPIVIPLSVAFAALVAALVAAWAANLLAPDGSRSQILRIVGVTEVAALAAGLLWWLLSTLPGVLWPFPALPLLLVVLVSAVAASLGSWRLRTRQPTRPLRHDALLSLAYLGLGAGAAVIVVLVACSIVPCVP